MDLAIAGGGLAGGLIALALAERRPDLDVTLFEAGDTFGGNHVWSFFESDIAPGDRWLVEPLIAARWDGYDVRFPRYRRRLGSPYRSITSETLDARLRAVLPAARLRTGSPIASLGPREVVLEDGTRIASGAVIDARGASSLPHMRGGWQKFLGQMLHLSAPHGLDAPIVMDATVDQHDGYRFVYCLPFSPTEVFVEDTYYADDARLDAAALRERVGAYAAARGWAVLRSSREETGVLPVIAGGDFDAFWPQRPENAARAGARAGLIHPLTSYSLPMAVDTAMAVVQVDNLSGDALSLWSRERARRHWRRTGFYRLLSTMLFGAAPPADRYRILERFYSLPAPLIERFYAGHSTAADKLRILAGKPPVPLGAALSAIRGKGRPLDDLGAPR